MELFLPWHWADTSGYIVWMAAVVVILIGTAFRIAGHRWEDWLDDRLGRGSIDDHWPGRWD